MLLFVPTRSSLPMATEASPSACDAVMETIESDSPRESPSGPPPLAPLPPVRTPRGESSSAAPSEALLQTLLRRVEQLSAQLERLEKRGVVTHSSRVHRDVEAKGAEKTRKRIS